MERERGDAADLGHPKEKPVHVEKWRNEEGRGVDGSEEDEDGLTMEARETRIRVRQGW